MEKIKVIGLHSFGSNGVSFYPGMEAEVDKKDAEQWVKAGLVKKANEDIEDAQLVEEPKELTPEEVERNNLETMAKKYGIEVNASLSDDDIEDLIHEAITKKKEEKANILNGSEENTQNSAENTNEQAENVNVEPNTEKKEPVLKKGKKTQSTAE